MSRDYILQGCLQGGLGGLQPPQYLTDQLTLSQPGGADYAHHSTTSPPGFSDLAAGLFLDGISNFGSLWIGRAALASWGKGFARRIPGLCHELYAKALRSLVRAAS